MQLKTTPGPWFIVPDRNFPGEENFAVLSPDRAPLFDSINRSPAADDDALEGDMRLAAAAPEMLVALVAARESISADRNTLYECCVHGDGHLDPEDELAVKDYDAILIQIDTAIQKATV
jgi:hypothetical protein